MLTDHCYRYDKLAFRYVSYVAIPTLAAYTGYSLMYKSHRGWYSFIISTLTSFVYMFGFVSFFGPALRLIIIILPGATCASTDNQLQTEGTAPILGLIFATALCSL